MTKAKPAFVYVALYCADTGEVALIPVPKDGDVSVVNRMTFSASRKFVWVHVLKIKLKINNPVRSLLTQQSLHVENPVPSKQYILCAFSTPERALLCLSRWVETKGEQDLAE